MVLRAIDVAGHGVATLARQMGRGQADIVDSAEGYL